MMASQRVGGMRRRRVDGRTRIYVVKLPPLKKGKKKFNICCPPAAVPCLFLPFLFLLVSPECRLCFSHLAAARHADHRRQMGWRILEVKLYSRPFLVRHSLFMNETFFTPGLVCGLWLHVVTKPPQ